MRKTLTTLSTILLLLAIALPTLYPLHAHYEHRVPPGPLAMYNSASPGDR